MVLLFAFHSMNPKEGRLLRIGQQILECCQFNQKCLQIIKKSKVIKLLVIALCECFNSRHLWTRA